MYVNPVPSLDDQTQSCTVSIGFTFPKPVTKAEAAESINKWFHYGGRYKLKPEHITLTGNIGRCYAEIQPNLSALDRDPDGCGPKPSV